MARTKSTAKVAVSLPAGTTTTKRSAMSKTLKNLLSEDQVKRMTVTPEIASELLEFNSNNRKVKQERINLYASSLKRGQWQFTGDAIRLATDDNGNPIIVDGQHRLMACVLAATPFETLVITGLDKEVFSVIDRGATRSNNDILSIAGITDGATISSMVRPLIALEAGLNPMVHGSLQLVTGEDLVEFCTKNEDLVKWAASLAASASRKIGGIRSAWGMFAYLAAEERGKKIVEKFIDESIKGIGLFEGDPRLALRSFMLRADSRSVTAKNYRQAGTIMRVFNAYVEGRKMHIVRPWGADSSATFPEISKASPFNWETGIAKD